MELWKYKTLTDGQDIKDHNDWKKWRECEPTEMEKQMPANDTYTKDTRVNHTPRSSQILLSSPAGLYSYKG